MTIDSDIEQFPDLPGILHPLDEVAKKLFHGRNTRLVENRVAQRISKQTLRTLHLHFPDGLFPSPKAQAVLDDLKTRLQLASGDDQTAFQLLLDNTFAVGDLVLVTASRHYKSMWLRDCWFAAMFSDSNLLKQRLVGQFGSMQRENGQIPTEVYYLPFNLIKHFRDDETTLLWMIMALETGYGSSAQLELGQRFIDDSHLNENGHYLSPAGSRRSIMDGLEFPTASRIAYLAGLYAYETTLAAEQDLTTTEVAQKAAEGYQQLSTLTEEGYLPLSDTLKWIDPMAFLGEYLFLTSRGKGILGQEVVSKTREVMGKWNLRKKGLGLATETGESVPAQMFINHNPYQESRFYLWEETFDNVCEMYGLINGDHRSETLSSLGSDNWREYRGAPSEKQWQLWNVYILKQQKEVAKFLANYPPKTQLHPHP